MRPSYLGKYLVNVLVLVYSEHIMLYLDKVVNSSLPQKWTVFKTQCELMRSQNSTFTPLKLSSMRLSNADHTKNPMGKELKDFVLDQCVLYLFSTSMKFLKQSVSQWQLSPILTLLPFQILLSAWYKLTALCDVDMMTDYYQFILLLQNRSQYLALFTKYVTLDTFEKIMSNFSTPNAGKGLLP